MLKFIKLDNPIFVLKDFDLALGCQKAYIRPDFSALKTKNAIILKCNLKNTAFLDIEKKLDVKSDAFSLFEGNLSTLVDKLKGVLFDNIYIELFIYNDRVHFPFYEARSPDIRTRASGTVTEAGDFDIKIKIYFSPEITREFPEELSALLTPEFAGWASYSLHVEKGEKTPFLKVESDRFRLNFERIETH